MNQNEIAAMLGVSQATVSYVMAGKAKENRISEEVVHRIRQVAQSVNYKPHGIARSLSRQRTNLIGILMRNAADRPFDNPAALEFLVGINLQLETAGYAPMFVRVGDIRTEGEPQALVFREHMLDGIIATGGFNLPLIGRLRQLSNACLWLDSTVWEPQRCVRRDEFDAGQQAAQMAIETGYREMVFYATAPALTENTQPHYSRVDRERGVRKAAADAKVPVYHVEMARNFDAPAQQAMIPLLRPDVAWVANDTFNASRLIHAADALGLRAGVDFGLVCCDEWEDTRATWPELSRVTFNRLDMGIAAADMLISLLRKPQMDCPSRVMRFPVHRGATLLGPEAHRQGPARSTQTLLERIADPRVSPPWSPEKNSVADKVSQSNRAPAPLGRKKKEH